jgi:transcriptional regulator with XRE-family HTH domain
MSRWEKLRDSREYRTEFVRASLKQSLPFQVRSMLKEQHLSQADLAIRAGLTQGVVSRATNPLYGDMTLKTCVSLASGFDIAFVGRFVPFSELCRWIEHLHDESIIQSFEQEDRVLTTGELISTDHL